MQTTVNSAIALKNNQNIFEEDGKTWAKTSWLRLWPKNPRKIDGKNLKKLEAQIKELGIYKPLIITPDGEILGGNQRFKVITELAKKDKRYEKVWVSVVEAWTDSERYQYCFSDNYSAGEYTREQLEIAVKDLDQLELFNNYDISFEEKQTLKEFVNSLAMSKEELQFKSIKKNLKELGINEETINTIEMMTTYNKMNEKLPDVDLKGKITGQKFPMLFWFDDEILFNQLEEIFRNKKDNYNTDKFISIVEKALEITFPTTKDRLIKLLKAVEMLENQKKDFIEFGKPIEETDKKLATIVSEVKRLLVGRFPEIGF